MYVYVSINIYTYILKNVDIYLDLNAVANQTYISLQYSLQLTRLKSAIVQYTDTLINF